MLNDENNFFNLRNNKAVNAIFFKYIIYTIFGLCTNNYCFFINVFPFNLQEVSVFIYTNVCCIMLADKAIVLHTSHEKRIQRQL